MSGEVFIHGQFVNSDLGRVARGYLQQEAAIADDEPHASERRRRLLRASSHLLLALAELDGIPVERAADDDRCRRYGGVIAPARAFPAPKPPTHVYDETGTTCRWCGNDGPWSTPCDGGRPVIEVLPDLSVRARTTLGRLGIATIGGLLTWTEERLLAEKNVGRTTVNELRANLRAVGADLACTT